MNLDPLRQWFAGWWKKSKPGMQLAMVVVVGFVVWHCFDTFTARRYGVRYKDEKKNIEVMPADQLGPGHVYAPQ